MRPKQMEEVLYNAILNRDDLGFYGDRGIGKSNIVEHTIERVRQEILSNSIALPKWTVKPSPENKSIVNTLFIHASISEPTDQRGLPAIKLVKIAEDKEAQKAVFVPFGELDQMINATGILVVFLDDFGQAPPLVQASFMQIILARRINEHVISSSCIFVVCTNERGKDTGVHGMLEPMKDRFLTLVKLETDWKQWVEWATSKRIVPSVIAYHKWVGNKDKTNDHLNNYRPKNDMTRSPSPRGWEFISKTIEHNYPIECLEEMFCGTIGEVEGHAFYSFLREYKDLVHPDLIIANPDTSDIPINKPSVMWSVLTALASRTDRKNFSNVYKYLLRLPPEWSEFLMVDIVRLNPDLKKSKEYIMYKALHSDTEI